MHAMSGASAPMSPGNKMAALFDKMSGGSDSISLDQLSSAFQTQKPPKAFRDLGPSQVFQKIDQNNDGKVSKDEFVSGMTSLMKEMRASHHHSQTPQSSTVSSSAQAMDAYQSRMDLVA